MRESFTGGQVGWTMNTSAPADVLVDLHEDLAVREPGDLCLSERDPETGRDLLREHVVRVPGEQLQLVRHGSRHSFTGPARAGPRLVRMVGAVSHSNLPNQLLGVSELRWGATGHGTACPSSAKSGQGPDVADRGGSIHPHSALPSGLPPGSAARAGHWPEQDRDPGCPAASEPALASGANSIRDPDSPSSTGSHPAEPAGSA